MMAANIPLMQLCSVVWAASNFQVKQDIFQSAVCREQWKQYFPKILETGSTVPDWSQYWVIYHRQNCGCNLNSARYLGLSNNDLVHSWHPGGPANTQLTPPRTSSLISQLR